MVVTKLTKIDSGLEDRSFLTFVFPEGNGESFRVRLPFYENPVIREGGKANYVEYNPQSRSSSLFSYTGAKSRTFNVDFNITLPMILELAMKEKRTLTPGVQSREALKELFFQAQSDRTVSDRSSETFEMTHGNARDFYLQYLYNKGGATAIGKELNAAFEQVQVYNSVLGIDTLTLGEDQLDSLVDNVVNKAERSDEIRFAINMVVYWINIIRSATLNNEDRPTLGPPTVRLNHGILYQNIPCICMSSKISYDPDKSGYDQRTMLPRVLKVTLSLAEHRTGNFGKYNINKIPDNDNLSGS